MTRSLVGVNIGGRAARFIYITSFWLSSLGISSFLRFSRIAIRLKVTIKWLNVA